MWLFSVGYSVEVRLVHISRDWDVDWMQKKRRLLVVVEGRQNALWDVRVAQYMEHFARSNYEVEIVARTTLSPIDRRGNLFQRAFDRCVFGPTYRKFIHRQEARIVRLAQSADVVYMVGVPSLRLQSSLSSQSSARIVMDVVDALWLPYHQQFGWEQFSKMASAADAVTCKTEAICNFVEKYNSKVFLVPDSPQLAAFDAYREEIRRTSSRVSLGWVGSPDSSPTLNVLHDVLENLAEVHTDLTLTILGGDPKCLTKYEKMESKLVERYDRTRMVRELLSIDIGLYPQPNDEDAIVRGASKARLYMSAGAVAACQHIGENASLIEDRVSGVLAGSESDWFKKLDWLISNRQERLAIGQRGLDLVRRDYSLDACFERLATALESV